MGDLASDLYVTSLEEVIWGGILVAITMAIHGLGMPLILLAHENLRRRSQRAPTVAKGIAILILVAWLILLVHLTEVLVWAFFLRWKNAFPNTSIAYYFSLNEYTTVGSGYSLPLRWRLLEGMIAMAGLLTFAWSTGILFTVAQEFQNHQLRRIRRGESHATKNGGSGTDAS